VNSFGLDDVLLGVAWRRMGGGFGFSDGLGWGRRAVALTRAMPTSQNRDMGHPAITKEARLLGGFSMFAFACFGLLGLGAEEGEEDYIADGFGVGEDHG
jgi:hypothetical protein